VTTSRKREGFKVTKRTATIDFAEGHDYHGLEVEVIISIPFSTLFWFQQSADYENSTEFTKEALHRFGDEFITSWNLEDDAGNPLPVSGDTLLGIGDYSLVTSLLEAWIQAVAEPSAPLSETSNDGDTSEEHMTNLATASASP